MSHTIKATLLFLMGSIIPTPIPLSVCAVFPIFSRDILG